MMSVGQGSSQNLYILWGAEHLVLVLESGIHSAINLIWQPYKQVPHPLHNELMLRSRRIAYPSLVFLAFFPIHRASAFSFPV
jgi:hypothetical protein